MNTYKSLDATLKTSIKRMGVTEATFNALPPSAQKALINEASKSEKERDKEARKLEKESLKKEYKGFLSIFNHIKGGTEIYKSVKPKSFNKFAVLGSMNFNEFANVLKTNGVYSFELVNKLVATYHDADAGEKDIIEKRGEIINALVMGASLKSLNEFQAETLNVDIETVITVESALFMYLERISTPYRIDSKGLKVSTVNKGVAKFLFSEVESVYTFMNLANERPIFHAEFTKPIETPQAPKAVLEVVETKEETTQA